MGILKWLTLTMSLMSVSATAQSSVTVRIDDRTNGAVIPEDFCGLSFESSNLLPDKTGKYIFGADNIDLIHLLRTIGIKNLRVGGGTADLPEYRIPTPADIDHLFAFAKAADVRIIYTLRLLNGRAEDDAKIAQYIQQHYASRLVCFEIGNEPDWHSFHNFPGHPRDTRIFEAVPDNPGSAFPSYLTTWRQFADSITVLVPDARFTGPDTGSNHPVPGTKNTDLDGQSWTWHFARDLKDSYRIPFVAQHDYVGQGAGGVSVTTAIDSMLSRDWVEKRYPLLFDHVLGPVQTEGLSYRMTEANDYTGGVDGASNAFASALWALDYLHWHGAHHAVGINFHNKRWIFTDTVLPDVSGKFHFNPKAYAIKAFDIASHGTPVRLSIENSEKLNLTAYAVRDQQTLYVTLINKEHGSTARSAQATIHASHLLGIARGMVLRTPNGDVAAKTGITLAGAAITTEGWNGQWTELNRCENDQTMLELPAASAVIVKLDLR